MDNSQKEIAFLRQCLLYGQTEERHKLEESIIHLQRSDRCVRRAVWLMVLLAALAMAGLGYSAIFLPDYPQNISWFTAQLITKAFCALGLGSLFCLTAFVVLGSSYRKKLDQQREVCRQLTSKLLETRLGNPNLLPFPTLPHLGQSVPPSAGA